MFGGKRLPIWTLVVVLILALAGLGLGYAHWEFKLFDRGDVTTGSFKADWYDVFTDDDNGVVDVNKDVDDTGSCLIGAGSCDPKAPGPNPGRYEKGVGYCWVILDENDRTVLPWHVSNAYPSYYCTIWGHIRNMGSVPMKIQARNLTLPPGSEGMITTGFIDGVFCGEQLDPSDLLQVGMWVHVENDADSETTYYGSSEYVLVNWNEWNPDNCGDLPLPPP